MRAVGAVLVLLLAALPAGARAMPSQTGATAGTAPQQPSRRRDRARRQADPAEAAGGRRKRAPTRRRGPARDAAMPLADRMAIQFDLIWTGDYNGLINGEFSDKPSTAVKAFQHDRKAARKPASSTRRSAPLLAAAGEGQAGRRSAGAWSTIPSTGARVGLPAKQVPNETPDQERHALVLGARPGPGRDLPHQRARHDACSGVRAAEEGAGDPQARRTTCLRPDFFVLSGMQNLKKFYVRAEIRDGEVRGITVLYDQAMESIMDPVVVAMSSAFAPFPGVSGVARSVRLPSARSNTAPASWSARPATSSPTAQLIEGCNVIVGRADYGDADRIAEDKAADLALLRVYGARDLVRRSTLSARRSKAPTSRWSASPIRKAQGGGSAITATAAKRQRRRRSSRRRRSASPARAALDGQGRLARHGGAQDRRWWPARRGKSAAAGDAGAGRRRSARFLEAQTRARRRRAGPASTPPRPRVVRVICVRK